MKKNIKQQVENKIYEVFKKMIFEAVEDPNAARVTKIKQLAQLGEKIESQIRNSLAHLASFMDLGVKTDDSFEFRRAIAEIGRIQKLAADYGIVITKAHEIAEGDVQEVMTPRHQDIPTNTHAGMQGKIPANKLPGNARPPQKPAPVGNITKPVKRVVEEEKEKEVSAKTTGDTNRFKVYAEKQAEIQGYKRGTQDWQDFMNKLASNHAMNYGVVLEEKYTNEIKVVDITNVTSLKEALVNLLMKNPNYRISKIVELSINKQDEAEKTDEELQHGAGSDIIMPPHQSELQ